MPHHRHHHHHHHHHSSHHSSNPLFAVLLIIKCSSGPRLVFHYPPNPSIPSTLFSSTYTAQASWYGGGSNSTDGGDPGGGAGGWGTASSESGLGDDDSDDEDKQSDEEEGEANSKSGHASTRGASGREGGIGKGRGIWGRQMEEEEGEDEEDEEDARGFRYGAGLGEKRDGKKKGREKEGKPEGVPEWERVLGYRAEALENLLCPNRVFHKKKFEMGIEGMVFVGCPMFVREDGAWKKRKRERKKRDGKSDGNDADESEDKNGDIADESTIEERIRKASIVSDSMASPDRIIYPPGWEPGYGHGLISGAASDAGSDAKSASSTTGADSDMTMFHVVFLLNPPALEYRLRVKEMYDNVVRKYAKALKSEQARYGYVWTEAKKILSMKSKAKESQLPMATLWPSAIGASTLAKSMALIYESISSGRIAHIHLDHNFDTSFEIPRPDWTPFIATPIDPQQPGLWLTTVNLPNKDDPEPTIARHCGLLLLEDKETLIKEIEGDAKAVPSPLTYYIRNLTPTKSLQKLSVAYSIPPRDIEFIAGHLVYWRRARLIPPLHPRDTYIVSPNCNMRALGAAIPAYAARFPSLPSLPKMLSLLSGAPRPYGSFIPSSDHKSVYMDILAWLMRGGWVTQLRTFAWVRVSAEIKAEVAGKLEQEARERDSNVYPGSEGNGDVDTASNGRNSASGDRRSITPSKRSPNRESGDHQDTNSATRQTSSPRLNAHLSPSRAPSDSGSGSSNRTTIGPANHAPSPRSQQAIQLTRPSPLHMNHSISTSSYPSSVPTDVSPQAIVTSPRSTSPNPNGSQLISPRPQPAASSFPPSLILNPQKANSEESRWLECIRQKFKDDDLKDMWPVLLKYLDGRHALDDVALREGLKRKRVAALLGQVREAGVLVAVRHW